MLESLVEVPVLSVAVILVVSVIVIAVLGGEKCTICGLMIVILVGEGETQYCLEISNRYSLLGQCIH